MRSWLNRKRFLVEYPSNGSVVEHVGVINQPTAQAFNG